MKFSRIALTSFATVFFVGKAYCAAPKEEEVNVLTDTAAIRSLQDDYTLLFNFKRTHDIRPDAELKFQSISINNTVVADGREFSLDGLTPMNVYTDDATYTVDGELQVGSPSDLSNIFTKTDGKHIIMVTTKGFGDEIDTVDIFGEDGSDIHMATIIPGVLTTIIPGDINPSTLEKLNLERDTMKAINDDDDDDNDGERLLRKKLRKKLKSMPQNPFENEKRALQSGCSTFRVIEIAIAFDSSFCSREGGFNSAKRSTEQIVARASQFYQAQGVCAKVRMTHLEANCISNQDPYRNVINGGFVCNEPNRDTILSQFGRFWRSNRSGIRRDVAHLFYGRDGQGSTIGCATVNALCSEQSGYGVNEISFSPNALARAVLFVHELGHNAGLSHVEGRPSSGAYIMASGLSTTSTYLWASFSVNRLKSNLSRFSCIGSEGGGTGGFSKKFMLINRKSGKALDVAGANCASRTNVHLWTVNRSSAQIFHYHYASEAIVNVACNKAIDISEFNCSNGANIFLYDRNGTGAQKFVFYSDDTIGSAGCRNKVIDVYKGYTSSGTNIQSWDRHSGDNQQWRVEYV